SGGNTRGRRKVLTDADGPGHSRRETGAALSICHAARVCEGCAAFFEQPCMSQQRRVVVTGMGLLTPVGNDLATFWSNITNGVSGVGPVTQFDVTDYDCKIAGEVRGFDPAKFFKVPKDVRRADRYTQLAVAAARLAM